MQSSRITVVPCFPISLSISSRLERVARSYNLRDVSENERMRGRTLVDRLALPKGKIVQDRVCVPPQREREREREREGKGQVECEKAKRRNGGWPGKR